MEILILGGTIFLGRAVVDSALARGHSVTTFTRGRTNPGLFDGKVNSLTGDRTKDVSALDGGKWDAVIDTCGYLPSDVELTAGALRGRAGTYQFVSSISAYEGDALTPGADESAEVSELGDLPADEVNGQTYGPLKVLCERAATAAFGDAALNVRPGLIVGPHDPTDRFTYWPLRLSRKGPALVPDSPGAATQVIDVRDLADWMVLAAERGLGGTFNATGPATEWSDFVAACLTEADPVAIPEQTLLDAGVRPWLDLPGWLPAGDDAIARISSAKAEAAGMRTRPLRETAQDTLAWARTWPADRKQRAGLDPELEERILTEAGALR